jgi:hypothetical protein
MKSNNAYPLARTDIPAEFAGLTKRELFAAMAMQGILGNQVYEPPRRVRIPLMAIDAVQAADALLAELAKEPQP